MAKKTKASHLKPGEMEKEHRVRPKEPQSSVAKFHGRESNTFPLGETPFLPQMDEHAALLKAAHSNEGRANLVLHLQRTYGNIYVQRLLNSMEVQAKLSISTPGDIYEQEADRVAEMVTKATASQTQRQEEEEEVQAQRQVEEEEEIQAQRQEEEEEVQAKLVQRQEEPEEEEEIQAQPVNNQPGTISDSIEASINSVRGNGQTLSESVREPMERSFGADFSDVQVHTDSEADTLNQKLNAKAFTTGQDIFFRQDEYNPNSDSGKKLIAHELTHVVQQSGVRVSRDDRSEAVASERNILKHGKHTVTTQPESVKIQRDWEPTVEDLKFLKSIHHSALDLYKLNDYIRYSGLYNMLEGFAQSEYSAENIHFLKDMEEYGPTPERAETIWHKYLMEGASEEINIPGDVMTALRTAYATNRQQAQMAFERKIGHSGPEWELRCPICQELKMGYGHVPGRALFNDAKKGIFNLVDTDTLPRFKAKAKGYAKG